MIKDDITLNMKDAVNLFLRCRCTYKALRELFILPCRNTITSYFGNLGLPRELEECKTPLQKYLMNSMPVKNVVISLGEIHVKPGLRYQSKQVIGNAVNLDVPCPANRVLALMINPSFGAPSFVARLLPVHCLKADFQYEQIEILVKLIHEAGGYVYSIMSDNLSVNQKMFTMFH